MLSHAEDVNTVNDAVKQMTVIVEDQVKNSLGDANYDRIVECLGVMRDELISYEEPVLYNHLLKQLKDKLLKEEFGGDRRELWWLIRRSKIGLIDRNQSDQSEVTEDEAKEVSVRCPSRIYRVRANCYSLCLRNKILVINSLVLERNHWITLLRLVVTG